MQQVIGLMAREVDDCAAQIRKYKDPEYTMDMPQLVVENGSVKAIYCSCLKSNFILAMKNYTFGWNNCWFTQHYYCYTILEG